MKAIKSAQGHKITCYHCLSIPRLTLKIYLFTLQSIKLYINESFLANFSGYVVIDSHIYTMIFYDDPVMNSIKFLCLIF